MKKVIDYIIIHSQTRDGLMEFVKARIKYDWQPIGGICAIYRGANHVESFIQTMVLFEKEKEEPKLSQIQVEKNNNT